MFLQLFCVPRTVQKERTTIHQLLNHVVLAHIRRIMTSHKVCLANQISGFDLLMSETQMGHGYTTRFLGIIIKICLCIHVSVITDNLDGVLVGAYGTICTQTPELTVGGPFWSGN